MDLAHLQKVVGELLSDVAYATGERPFPGKVTVEEAADIAAVLHTQMEGGTAKRAQLAVANGVRIACGEGCTGCCEAMVIVSLPEALGVVRWLALPENAAACAAFLESYPRWRETAGDAPERLAALTVSNKDREEYAKAHVEYWRQRVLCAFNRDGNCSIYPVRPLVCREAHAVDTNERCFGDYQGEQRAAQIQMRSMVDFLAGANRVLQAAHNAISERTNQYEALCAFVHRLLTEQSV